MKTWRKITSAAMSLLLLLSLTACGAKPEEPSGSDVSGVETRPGETTSASESSAPSETEPGADATDPVEPGKTTSGNTASTTTGNSTTKPTSGGVVDDNLETKYKNLKGRKITVVGWWDPTPSGTEDYKLILEVEKKFNCDLVERKLTDYAPLYSSILAGAPIADLFVPQDVPILNMANKNMLIALDTLPSMDVNDPLWNKAVTAESTLDGHVYGVTQSVARRSMLAYNKTMFEKNNWPDLYTLSTQGKLTWDTLYDIMGKAAQVDAGGNVTRYGLIPKYDFGNLGSFLLNMNGVKVVTRQGTGKTLSYTLNGNKATNALNTLQEWNSKKGAMYDVLGKSWDSTITTFTSGKGAMLIVDENSMSQLSSVDFKVGLTMFPHGPDASKDVAFLEPSATVIPAGVSNPDDVALFWTVYNAYKAQNKKQNIFDSLDDPSVKATYAAAEKAMNSGNYIYDYAEAVGLDEEVYRNVAAGSTTPAAAIQSIQNQAKGKIADFWK